MKIPLKIICPGTIGSLQAEAITAGSLKFAARLSSNAVPIIIHSLLSFLGCGLMRPRLKVMPDNVDKKIGLRAFTGKTPSFEHIPLITAYALIQWIFEYPRQSNGYGVPFDRPCLDFYRRLQNAHRLLREIKNVYLRGNIKDNRPFYQIYWATKMAVEDKQLNALAANLERKAEVFDKLRTAMRIALPESKSGINDNGDDADMKIILDGCSNLAERFSKIDAHMVQQKMKEANNNSEKILPAIRKLIRDSELTQKIASLFLSASKISANCHLRS